MNTPVSTGRSVVDRFGGIRQMAKASSLMADPVDKTSDRPPAELCTTDWFGGRLRNAMEAAGVNQSVLARRIGVAPPAVQKLLSGQSKATRHIVAIAKVLGVDPGWLQNGVQPPANERAADMLDLSVLSPSDRLALITIYNSLRSA